jgi:beta-galactosidase
MHGRPVPVQTSYRCILTSKIVQPIKNADVSGARNFKTMEQSSKTSSKVGKVFLCGTPFTSNEWRDPQCVEVNKEYPRTSFYSFKDSASSLKGESIAAGDVTESRGYVNLDSKDAWGFKWFPNAASCINASSLSFSMSDPLLQDGGGAAYSATFKNRMSVPGNWELQGEEHSFGFPIYTNIGYAWAGGGKQTNPPAIEYQGKGREKDYNPSAIYHRIVTLPDSVMLNDKQTSSSSQQYYLHIGAVTSCVYVIVNHQLVGYSQDSKLPCEFNITAAMQKNVNNGVKTIEIELVVTFLMPPPLPPSL